MKSPKILSLFSGCGGLDFGFRQAGFTNVLSIDIEKTALAVHQENLDCPVQQLDLSTENPAFNSKDGIDVLLAGSPCQGFSTAGMRRVDDPRNELLFVAHRVATRVLPKVVVAENVPGALSGEHRAYWDALHLKMKGLGYQTHDLHVNSSDFGVAQKRQRIFLIAWRTGATPNFNVERTKQKVLADVLNGLEGAFNHAPIFLDKCSNDFKIATRIKQGQKLTNSRSGDRSIHTWDIPEVFGRTTKLERDVLIQVLKLRRQVRRRDFGDADPVSTSFLAKKYGGDVIARLVSKEYLRKLGHYHDLTNTFNGKYRRLSLDGHSRTVDTRFGDHRLFLHPIEHRAFTVREAARIQGFPDGFIFSGTNAQQFRMIGNAVPPPLAHSVAKFVRSLL